MEHEAECLSVHADYGCRHRGACCTAGWAIPVEEPTFQKLAIHFGRGSVEGPLFVSDGALPDGAAAILAVRSNGACVFYEAERGGLCAVHRELGPRHLPTACRQFPRVVRRTRHSTQISLSHFCPTAADLLISPGDLRVVPSPTGLSLDGDLESLDARNALPPLLRPGLLTDDEGCDTWERRALAVLAQGDRTAEEALSTIAAATTESQSWRPGGASLRNAVERAFDQTRTQRDAEDPSEDVRRVQLVLMAVPAGLAAPAIVADFASRWPVVSRWWRDYDASVRAYLAARLFGNWMAYYGQGLHAVVEYLRICLSVLKMEAVRHEAASTSPCQNLLRAVRASDLLMVHLSDVHDLARRMA
jgi:Fe-S-cluster containining protein